MDSPGRQLRRREEARRNLILAGWPDKQNKQQMDALPPRRQSVDCASLGGGRRGKKAGIKGFGFAEKNVRDEWNFWAGLGVCEDLI